jgi:hypothetical protein
MSGLHPHRSYFALATVSLAGQSEANNTLHVQFVTLYRPDVLGIGMAQQGV